MMRKRPRISIQAVRRRGIVMVAATLVLIVLASLVLVMAGSVRVEAMASANRFSQSQARAIALGAAQAVLAMGEEAPTEAVEVNGGGYWLLKPYTEDDKTYSFGIIDESARMNINAAPPEVLALLPGMNNDLADAILDWRDSDNDVGGGGAESEYYMLLPSPYDAKNQPFESVEELMLVKDFTALELFGEDLNRNGILDPNEDDADDSDPPDNKDGKLDRGVIDLVTAFTRESANNPDGGAKVNIKSLSSGSSKGGSKGGSKSGGGSSKGGGSSNDDLRNVLDQKIGGSRAELLYNQIISNAGSARNLIDVAVKSQMQPDELDKIADYLTVEAASSSGRGQTNAPKEIKWGKININTAPKEVLLTLPNLTESDVQTLISSRSTAVTDPAASTSSTSSSASTTSTSSSGTTTINRGMGWVMQALSPEKAVAIGDHITGRSSQFSVDIVAVSGDGRAFERYRMVYDVSGAAPVVLYWKRLTHLGWPLDPQILADLRSGKTIGELAASAQRSTF